MKTTRDGLSYLEIKLTEDQIEQLEPLYQLSRAAYENDEPGMLLGRVSSGNKLLIAFIPHRRAQELAAIGGGINAKGLI